MANIKLVDDYWETSGIYDAVEKKTQREINSDLKNTLSHESEKRIELANEVFTNAVITDSNTTTISGGIGNANIVLYFDIPAGTAYKFTVTYGAGISTFDAVYAVDENETATAIRYIPVSGMEYQVGASQTKIIGFSFYVSSSHISTDTDVTIEAEYTLSNNNSLESKLEQQIGTDKTLTVPNKAADAKQTGRAITAAENNSQALNEKVNTFMSKVFDKVLVSGSALKILAASGQLGSENPFLNIRIPANTSYKYKVTFSAGISNVAGIYATDANGNTNNVRYSPASGTIYSAVSTAEIVSFSLYIRPASVTADSEISIYVEFEAENDNALSTKITNSITEYELIKGGNGVFHENRYEIGAEDGSGGTTYIWKDIIDKKSINGAVSVKVDKIENATYSYPIVIYFFDNSNSLISEHDITIDRATMGISVYPPVTAVAYSVRLYPSITGGLVDVKAVYTNLVVFESPWAGNYFNWFTDNDPHFPYYYMLDNYIDGKIATIRNLMEASGGNYDAFVFCTDQHWPWNAKRSSALIKYIREQLNIKRLFMGGDMANGINMDAIKAYKIASDGIMYNVTGNHEYMDYFEENGRAVPQTIDESDIWIYLDSGMMDAIVGNPGRQYYYIDNPVQKMRYIILNVYANNGASAIAQFETAQKEWFQNIALDLPSSYTAVVFAHFLYGVDYDTGDISIPTITTEIESIVDAYSGDGEIACLISGHTHVDGMTTTSGGVPAFITTCDKYLPWINGGVDMEPWLSENRHLGTITEQAFDVVVIDKTNKLISFVRIGAPADNGTGTKLEIRQQQYGT